MPAMVNSWSSGCAWMLIARLGEVARVTVLRRKLTARGQSVPVTTLVGTLVTEQYPKGIGHTVAEVAEHLPPVTSVRCSS